MQTPPPKACEQRRPPELSHAGALPSPGAGEKVRVENPHLPQDRTETFASGRRGPEAWHRAPAVHRDHFPPGACVCACGSPPSRSRGCPAPRAAAGDSPRKPPGSPLTGPVGGHSREPTLAPRRTRLRGVEVSGDAALGSQLWATPAHVTVASAAPRHPALIWELQAAANPKKEKKKACIAFRVLSLLRARTAHWRTQDPRPPEDMVLLSELILYLFCFICVYVVRRLRRETCLPSRPLHAPRHPAVYKLHAAP